MALNYHNQTLSVTKKPQEADDDEQRQEQDEWADRTDDGRFPM
jgi:hypothetical protein